MKKIELPYQLKNKAWLRTSLLALLMLLGTVAAHAQQDPMFTQYMSNVLLVNPAYAAAGTSVEVMAISRNQWTGIEGAPVTQTLSGMLPFRRANTGIGLSFLSDKIGPVSQTGAYFDYAFKLRLDRRVFLSLGVKGGVNFYNTDYSVLRVNDGGDPIFSDDVVRKFLPNFGLGAFLNTDRLFIGLSVPKLMTNRINDVGYSTQFSSREEMHFFLSGGYVFDLSDRLKFKPYTYMKFVQDAPVSVDLSAHFLLYERVWLGANWRIGDAVGAIAQLYINQQFKVGYAYDVTASDLSSFNRGTHEILISYALNMGRRRFLSPRYF